MHSVHHSLVPDCYELGLVLSLGLHRICHRQVPVGTCSSSIKNWGWVVAQRRCLNSSTTPMQALSLDLAGATYHIVTSSMLCFLAQPGQFDLGESCVVLENGATRSLVAKAPQHSSLAVCKYVLELSGNTN